MSDETWLNAKKAVELGFADEILFADKPKEDPDKDEPEEKPDTDPDEPDKEKEGGDEKEEQKKPFKLKEAGAVWQYSTKTMGQTILNRLGVSDEAAVPETHAPAQEPAQAGMTDSPAEDKPKAPVIGMDGKTEDGSVPYEILKDRLEWMR